MAYNYGNYTMYNPGYVPSQPYQNQMLMQQSQQIPIAAPQTVPATTQGISPVSRPVSNREEAVAAQIPFDGSISVFPDITHNRVYIKRWNMQTGASDFGEFAPVVQAAGEPAGNKADAVFASIQDFQDLQETVNNLQKEFERLKKIGGKTAKKNDDEQ